MPKGGDLSQYKPQDWSTQSSAESCMYDLCRDTGEPPDMARRHAQAGARQLTQQLQGERTSKGRVTTSASVAGAGAPRTADGRCKRRVPWPWETGTPAQE